MKAKRDEKLDIGGLKILAAGIARLRSSDEVFRWLEGLARASVAAVVLKRSMLLLQLQCPPGKFLRIGVVETTFSIFVPLPLRLQTTFP